MKYEVIKDQKLVDAWRVEAIDYDNEGEVYITVFFEPKAEQRAREYATAMCGELELHPA
jgi:hypothetical protein